MTGLWFQRDVHRRVQPVQQHSLHPTLRQLPRDGGAQHATAQDADLACHVGQRLPGGISRGIYDL